MTNKDKIDFLAEYSAMKQEIRSKNKEISKLIDQKEKLSSGLSMGPKNGAVVDKVQKTVEEIDCLERELIADRLDLIKKRRLIRKAIITINKSIWRQSIELHYVEGVKIRDIALELHYSEPQVKRFIAAAVEMMEIKR